MPRPFLCEGSGSETMELLDRVWCVCVCVCVGGGGGGGGGGGWVARQIPRKFLWTSACRKNFAEHPDTPTLTLHRYIQLTFGDGVTETSTPLATPI